MSPLVSHHSDRPIKVGAYVVPYCASYQQIRDAWLRVEAAGADVIYQPDHFTTPRKQADQVSVFPGEEVFETWSLMAAMAEVTDRVEMGTLVTANGYRNPNLLADIVRTVDHVSGGRVILGIGAGDRERDFAEYGYDYPPAGTRLRQLDRDLVTIRDRFSKLTPPPTRQVPILIGGKGEQVTLRIVAKHADIWHASGGDVDVLAHKRDVLYGWCREIDRDPSEIELATFTNKWSAHGTKLDDPGRVLALGFTHLIAYVYPPDYDTTDLVELLDWRSHHG